MQSQENIHVEQTSQFLPNNSEHMNDSLPSPHPVVHLNQSPHATTPNTSQYINDQTVNPINSSSDLSRETTNPKFFIRLWESTKTYLIYPFLMAMAASIGLSVGYALFDSTSRVLSQGTLLRSWFRWRRR
jgi:hypothetical protein